jgi:hypothetical protein
MVSSTLILSSAITLFASLTTALPTRSTPIYPPKTTSANFRLVANVTSNDLTPSINNYVLTSYHTGAGEAYAVLQPNETVTSGRIFYLNGTATDIRYNNGNILSDEGTPLFPAGLIINPSNSANEQTVSINAGTGEAGVGLTSFPDPISALDFKGQQGYYACVNELEYGSAVQLLFKSAGQETPAGCADVNLLPQCSEGSGAEHPFGETSECYEDVAGIDWSYYNTD